MFETIPCSFSKLSKELDRSDGNSGELQFHGSWTGCFSRRHHNFAAERRTAHSVAPRENMVSFEFSCFKKFLSHLNLGGWRVGPTRPGKEGGG